MTEPGLARLLELIGRTDPAERIPIQHQFGGKRLRYLPYAGEDDEPVRNKVTGEPYMEFFPFKVAWTTVAKAEQLALDLAIAPGQLALTPKSVVQLWGGSPRSVWYGTAQYRDDLDTGLGGRGTEADVIGLYELVLDVDFKAVGGRHEAGEFINRVSGKVHGYPVGNVWTGNGAQPHWKLKNRPTWEPGDLEEILRAKQIWDAWVRLAQKISIEMFDQSIDVLRDLPRVWRSPGTWNAKIIDEIQDDPAKLKLWTPKQVTTDFYPESNAIDWLSLPDLFAREGIALDPALTIVGAPVKPKKPRAPHEPKVKIPPSSDNPSSVGEYGDDGVGKDWGWAKKTCRYATPIVAEIGMDTPPADAATRHGWGGGKATKLANLHFAGCITHDDHTWFLEQFVDNFEEITADRGGSAKEITDWLAWAERKIASKGYASQQECRDDQFGGHTHDDAAEAVAAAYEHTDRVGALFDRIGVEPANMPYNADGTMAEVENPDDHNPHGLDPEAFGASPTEHGWDLGGRMSSGWSDIPDAIWEELRHQAAVRGYQVRRAKQPGEVSPKYKTALAGNTDGTQWQEPTNLHAIRESIIHGWAEVGEGNTPVKLPPTYEALAATAPAHGYRVGHAVDQGADGPTLTYSVTALDTGDTRSTTHWAQLEELLKEFVDPPVDPTVPTEEEVAHALRKRAVALAVQAVDDAEKIARVKERVRSAFMTADQVMAMPPQQHVVDVLLPADATTVWVTAPGCYKSFAALDLMAGVALGGKYHDLDVDPGYAVVIAAEGFGGYGQRMRAWQRANKNGVPQKLAFFGYAPDMFTPGSAEMIIEIVKERIASVDPAWDGVINAFCWDTLNRVRGGANENLDEIGNVLENCNEVRSAFPGAANLVLHHTNKAGDFRGHSSILGNADMMLIGEKAGKHLLRLDSTEGKVKDGPEIVVEFRVDGFDTTSHGEKSSSSLAVVKVGVIAGGGQEAAVSTEDEDDAFAAPSTGGAQVYGDATFAPLSRQQKAAQQKAAADQAKLDAIKAKLASEAELAYGLLPVWQGTDADGIPAVEGAAYNTIRTALITTHGLTVNKSDRVTHLMAYLGGRIMMGEGKRKDSVAYWRLPVESSE